MKLSLIVFISTTALLTACMTPDKTTPQPQQASTPNHCAQTQEYQGSITGYNTKELTFHAQAGQKISIDISTSAPYAYFNVFASTSTVDAIFNGSIEGGKFEKTATQTGIYKIVVYQMRASARRNQTAPYHLTISTQ